MVHAQEREREEVPDKLLVVVGSGGNLPQGRKGGIGGRGGSIVGVDKGAGLGGVKMGT